MNLHRSRITGSTLQAAPESWCIAVTLTHKATENGHGYEVQDMKWVSAVLCVAVLHIHNTQAAPVPPLFISVSLPPSLSASFFPTFFSLFLPPSFHSVLSRIFGFYLSSLHYYIFLPLLFLFSFCFFFYTSFSLFLPLSFYSVLSGILRLHPSSLHSYIFLSFLSLFLLPHSHISSNHPLFCSFL